MSSDICMVPKGFLLSQTSNYIFHDFYLKMFWFANVNFRNIPCMCYVKFIILTDSGLFLMESFGSYLHLRRLRSS